MGIPEEGGGVIIKKIDVERRAWLKNLFGWPYTVSFWWKNGRASYFICFLLPPTSSDVTGIETSNLLVSSLAFLTILDEPLDSALMIVHNGYNIWRNPILLTDLASWAAFQSMLWDLPYSGQFEI